MYGNEAQIGEALDEIVRSGIPRDQLRITSKLWNDMHAPEGVIRSCRKSLDDLRLKYVDPFLVHWPFPNHHPPGCGISSRTVHAKSYIHEELPRASPLKSHGRRIAFFM